MYSWMVLFALLATAFFLHAFVFRRRRHLIGFSLSLALMLYTHNWAVFFILASLTALAVLAWKSPQRRELIKDGVLSYGGALILFAPWLPTVYFQMLHTGAPWSNRPSVGTLWKAAPATLDGVHIAMAVVLAGGAGLAGIIQGRRGRERAAVIAGLVLFFGTLLWAWVASEISPAWAYRYFAVFVAPLLLMAGLGLSRAGRLGMVATVLILAFWIPYHAPSNKSIDRFVVHHAGKRMHPGDLVVVTQPEQVPVVNYYANRGLRFATEFGLVKDNGVMNWIDAEQRLRAATPEKDLEPLLATLRPGQHVLLMRPVIGDGSGWKAPWTKLVRERSADWARALEHDPRFKLVRQFPHPRRNYYPRGMRGLLFIRR